MKRVQLDDSLSSRREEGSLFKLDFASLRFFAPLRCTLNEMVLSSRLEEGSLIKLDFASLRFFASLRCALNDKSHYHVILRPVIKKII
ncbi:hypothetical protein GIHI108528_05770 [Gillisia hiemivivida]